MRFLKDRFDKLQEKFYSGYGYIWDKNIRLCAIAAFHEKLLTEQDCIQILKRYPHYDGSALCAAIETKSLNLVRFLVSDQNHTVNRAVKYVSIAAKIGDESILNFLFAMGALTSCYEGNSESCLKSPIEQGNILIIKLLITNHAVCDNDTLHVAADKNNHDNNPMSQRVYDYLAAVNAIQEFNKTIAPKSFSFLFLFSNKVDSHLDKDKDLAEKIKKINKLDLNDFYLYFKTQEKRLKTFSWQKFIGDLPQQRAESEKDAKICVQQLSSLRL